jgi:hypothetical protein
LKEISILAEERPRELDRQASYADVLERVGDGIHVDQSGPPEDGYDRATPRHERASDQEPLSRRRKRGERSR